MRSLGGLVLLAGVGVGLFVYLPTPVDRSTSLDQARQLAATRPAQSQPSLTPAPQRLHSFAPAIPLTTFARREAPAQAPSASVKVVRAPATATQDDAAEPWHTAVTAANAPAQTQPASLEPGDPESRYKLIVEIQQQLKRVGCYYGRTDGSWGAGTKEAMMSFTDRVNAALPIEQPDYVLLTLLQAQSGRTCDECPAGQAYSAGRCVPQAIIAQTRRKDEAQAGTPTTPTKEVLPWKAAGSAAAPSARPLFTPVPTSVVSTEPLPGRMAIGAPKALPPVDSGSAEPVAVGAGQQGVATAALDQSAAQSPPLGSSASAAPKRRPTGNSYNKRSSREDGPGTPRYNLLLSLGGAY
jgi:hypothetical protein